MKLRFNFRMCVNLLLCRAFTGTAILFAVVHISAAPSTPMSVDGSFEEGLTNWRIGKGEAISSLSTERAATGANSIKITDNDAAKGSDIASALFPVESAQYLLKGKVFPVSGNGLGLYIRVYDKDKTLIGKGDQFLRSAPSTPIGQWIPWSLNFFPPPEAAYAEIWIHSYNAALVTAFIDDLEIERIVGETKPPWPGSYKIYPTETTKLTAADVVGPDGIVYPDWRYAGVPGGIPDVPIVARIEEFGAIANDELDDSQALEKGAAAVGARGGGALMIGAGTYYLDRPVRIFGDGVVLRGAGRQTRLIFRYDAPPQGVRFISPAPDSLVTPATWIEAHADPDDLQRITIYVDGQLFREVKRNPHWGATFSLRADGWNLATQYGDGAHTLRAVAEYPGGKVVETSIPIRASREIGAEEARIPSHTAAIMFCGAGKWAPTLLLERDGKRGDRELLLKSVGKLKAGDRIRLRAPATPRWNTLVKNAGPQSDYRRYEFIIEAVDGNTIRLNQPLRIEFPVVDGAYVQQIFPIRRCGVENLYLEQTSNIWTSGVIFSNAWECWARGVTVKKAGRFPLYMTPSKWCEIRDCVFDDAWNKGGGGTAYVGWEYAFDGLMENVETFAMRHAPLVQWSAAGNVIRNSTFHGSDGQYHSGWTNENLYENCIIESSNENGSTGNGLWASPPEDEAHGPNGPRNVIYNCDVSSPRAGLWVGGMNEGWLILHNRFKVGGGPGVYMKDASFDHIFEDNIWMMQDTGQPVIYIATADCIGVELRNNLVLGSNGELTGGPGVLLVERENRIQKYGDAPRPKPAVPSIFEWQRKQPR